jgi:hypothetical protein
VNGIRPYEHHDSQQVLDLHRAVFGATKRLSAEAHVAAYYESFLLGNPWRDPALPSLVYENAGRIRAFLGVIPREFSFRGVPLRVAIATRFMAQPGSVQASIGAAAIVRHFLGGPQDLALTDGTPEVRTMWTAMGALVMPFPSIRWKRILRPTLLALRVLRAPERREQSRPRAGVRLVTDKLDSTFGRLSRRPFAVESAAGSTRAIGADELRSLVERRASAFSLRPTYHPGDLDWFLGYLEGHSDRGRIEPLAVVSPEGSDIGWFVHHRNPGGADIALQVVALEPPLSRVVKQLLHSSWRSGAVFVEGRLDSDLLHALGEDVYCRQPGWKLAMARDPAILDALVRGDAFLTALEGDPLS